MQTIRSIDDLRAAISVLRTTGRIALVPTMGALHDGHVTLMRTARLHAEHVVASIFVNPAQFGPNEDLDAYPRREAADAALLEAEGVRLLWAPDVGVMYPPDHATRISVAGLDAPLCGATRPGHFDGVATVVAKLFQQVGPDIAVFGEKDWQQLAIIRRMARDLDFAIDIVGVPTVREADGLAMSSRNAYLSEAERAIAGKLPAILRDLAHDVARSPNQGEVLGAGRAALLSAGFTMVDYLEMRDETTLALLDIARPGARLFVAARIGSTRLIDNMPCAVAAR